MSRVTGPVQRTTVLLLNFKGTANNISFVEFRYFSLSFSVVGDYLHHGYATLRTPAAKIGEANLVRMLSRTIFTVVIVYQQKSITLCFRTISLIAFFQSLG